MQVEIAYSYTRDRPPRLRRPPNLSNTQNMVARTLSAKQCQYLGPHLAYFTKSIESRAVAPFAIRVLASEFHRELHLCMVTMSLKVQTKVNNLYLYHENCILESS